jgi:hypothetical protein
MVFDRAGSAAEELTKLRDAGFDFVAERHGSACAPALTIDAAGCYSWEHEAQATSRT